VKNGCTNSSNELKNCQTGANNSFCQEPGQYYAEKDETKRSNSGCFPSNEQQNIEPSKNQARATIYVHLKDQGNIGNGVIIYIGRHISSKEPYRPTIEHVCFTSEFAEPYRIKETLFVQGAYVGWRLPTLACSFHEVKNRITVSPPAIVYSKSKKKGNAKRKAYAWVGETYMLFMYFR
jgi:hypothetical protein